MKTTRIFAAAIALLSVLSCQKEEQQVIDNSASEGVNLITCTFANNDAATKTTLEGMTPKWAAGDTVVLYNSSNDTLHLTLAASGTASSRTGIIDGTDATKFTFVRPDGWTDVYAIYPSVACVNSYPLPKLKFSEQDGTFGKANICVAAEISGTMSFKNVGAILKFPSKPATVTKITIDALGSVNKNYKISFDGATPSLTPVGSTYLPTTYSIGEGTDAIYIGVPSCTIPEESVFTYKSSTDVTLGTYTTGAANTVEANKIYNLGAMMGTLSGLFTVAEGKQVQFSQGNLQATVDASGTPSAWNFAADQYGYIGDAVANTSIGSTAGVVDLFGWSTDATSNNWGIHTKRSHTEGYTTGDFANWGKNAIANGGNTANQWNTLSKDEWKYLLNTRTVNGGTGEGKSYQMNTLTLSDNTTTVYGMIIAPDNYTGSLSATTSWSDWQTMESAGCVFLPAAGSRTGEGMNSVGSNGSYWSATPGNSAYAYYLIFKSGEVTPTFIVGKCFYGRSVRLVCAAQ